MGKFSMRDLRAEMQSIRRGHDGGGGGGGQAAARKRGPASKAAAASAAKAAPQPAVVISRVKDEAWMEEIEALAGEVLSGWGAETAFSVRPLMDGKGRFRHLVKVVRDRAAGDDDTVPEMTLKEAFEGGIDAEKYPTLAGAKLGVKLVGVPDTKDADAEAKVTSADAAAVPAGTGSPTKPGNRKRKAPEAEVHAEVAGAEESAETSAADTAAAAAPHTRSIILVGNVKKQEDTAGLRRALAPEFEFDDNGDLDDATAPESSQLALPLREDNAENAHDDAAMPAGAMLIVSASRQPAATQPRRKKRKANTGEAAAGDATAHMTFAATVENAGETTDETDAAPSWTLNIEPLFNSKTKAFRKMVKVTLLQASAGADAAAATSSGAPLLRGLAAEAVRARISTAYPAYRVVVKDEDVDGVGEQSAGGAAAGGAGADVAAKPASAVKYFIGNLPKGEHGGEEPIRDAFIKACGAKISSLKVLKDEYGLPNGCAVVAFAKTKQAEAAVTAVEREKVFVGGRVVRMEQQKSKEELSERGLIGDKHVVFAANLPLTLTQDQIRFALRKFGAIERVTMNRSEDGSFNGTARVTYEDAASVATAVQNSMNLLINRRPIRLDLDKRKAARTAQLDLNASQSHSKTVVVQPTNPAVALVPAAVKAVMASIGKLKFCRRTKAEECPADMEAAAAAGAVTVCFTTSACVGLAMQLVGREVDCVPLADDDAATEARDAAAPQKCSIIVKVLEDAEAKETAAKPKEPIQFTFNGARYWNNKEWAKQKRLESLESWNRKGWW